MNRISTGLCWLLLGVVAGCQCSEKRQPPPTAAPAPLGPEAPFDDMKPAVTPLAGCDGFLVDQDIEKACGLPSGTLHGAIDHKEACLKRFKHPAYEAASVVLSVRPEDNAKRAMRQFKKAVAKSKKQANYARIEGVGEGAQTFTKTKGEGEKLRAVQALDFVHDRFVVQLRELHRPDAKGLCPGAKLPELAKLVVKRLGATPGAEPAAAPATEPSKAAAEEKPAPGAKTTAEVKPAAPKPEAKDAPVAKPKPTAN